MAACFESGAMLSMVCPVYNEGENIARLIDSIAANVRVPWELLLVYDRDDDDTLPPARRIARERGLPIVFTQNQGHGVLGALKTGLARAERPAVAVIMGDCSDDLAAVDAMYDLLERGFDVVCGSRYMRGGRQIGAPWLKSRLSHLAGLSLHALTGIPTHDVSNNFKMYRRSFLASVRIESLAGFELGLELLVKAFVYGYAIAETPVTWTERTHGKSRFRLARWLPHYLRWYYYALRYRKGRVFA